MNNDIEKLIKLEGDYKKWDYTSPTGYTLTCEIVRNPYFGSLCGYIFITDDCFDEISNHSYKSKYSKGIFDFIEKINSFVESKKVNNINFEECCSHTTEESDTRLKQFKGQLAVKNCKGQKEVASWHTRINNDFRLYFTLDIENNKICLVKLTKKIS